MSNKTYRIVWLFILLLYSIAAGLAYFFEVKPLLFALALPWSTVATILSPLIGHAYGHLALQRTLLLCEILNACVLLAIALRPRDSLRILT
ncbi:MAG: hypothetical protein IPJ30_10175 [Acidobacteria bacterium]|nr:hypothetical protein [Acidobacteriota bacterium]